MIRTRKGVFKSNIKENIERNGYLSGCFVFEKINFYVL
jgi:hypothetical protein